MARYLCPPFLVLILLLSGDSATGAPAAASAAADPVQGDVNCDEAVNSIDSLQILRSVAGLSTSAECLAEAGDVNCDDAVNSVDSLRILRYVAGLPNTTPEGCSPIGEPLAIGPNSYELIQEALDAGEIDSETALTYKVFVTFGDPRLPAEYHGDDSGVWDDHGAVSEAVATLDTLSPATQQTLAPFLVSPDAPGSWQQLRAGATAAVPAQAAVEYLPVETTHVNIWFRADRSGEFVVAQALANEVENNIWGTQAGLMGDPPDDLDRIPNGGDGRVDVFLTSDPRLVSHTTPTRCKHSSAFVALAPGGYKKEVLTRQLMWVFTAGFDVQRNCQFPEYEWFRVATGWWSIDFVYPSSQFEQNPGVSPDCLLDQPSRPLELHDPCHAASAYLFPFYLDRFEDEVYIRGIWDAFAGYDSLAAIDAAVGLTEVWKSFALFNYNRDPAAMYQREDGILKGAALEADEVVSLNGAASRKYFLRGDAVHLSAFYHRYRLHDQDIREVKFTHSLTGQPTAYIRVLIHYEGDPATFWIDDDWTPEDEHRFCYDDPGQKRIDELVIIITNSEFTNRSHMLASNPQPELEVKNICRLTGDAVGHYLSERGAQGDYREEWTVTADIEWVEDPGFFPGCNCRVFFPEGEIHWAWDFRYFDPPCHDSESGTLPAGPPPLDPTQQWLVLWEDPDNPDQYFYSGYGYIPVTWFSDCENGERQGLTFFNIPNPVLPVGATAQLRPTRLSPQGLPVPFCDDVQWVIPRSLATLVGECYDAGFDDRLLKYNWNFRVPAPP